MSPQTQIQALANSVYLLVKNRYYGDLTTSAGKDFVNAIIDFGNQFLDELETETDATGRPVDWWWARQMDFTLGTVSSATQKTILVPSSVLNIVADEGRFIQVTVGSKVVSNWAVVSPRDIDSRTDRSQEDRVAVAGGQLVFSRTFRDTEVGGTITGDVTLPIPRLSLNNAKALSTIKPKELLILGIAKNASLPDIVQGGLSPSFVQKYGDLLEGAIARSMASSVSDTAARDDLAYISGVGF